jgi:hypothetical protein
MISRRRTWDLAAFRVGLDGGLAPSPTMGLVRIALGSDRPAPFKFRKGDRVLVRPIGQAWLFGIVVGGSYEGPPPEGDPGFYRITYWIRRSDGQLFESDEVDMREPVV